MTTRNIIYLLQLDRAVRAICPIDGLNSEGVIQFRDEATEAQRVAAQTAVDAWVDEPPPQLSPIEKIRVLEDEFADDQARLMRQVCIETTLVQACARPEAVGFSRAQVHALLMAQGKGYAKLVLLEQQVAEIRTQLP